MWREFYSFDTRYLLRQPVLWFAVVLFAGLALACAAIPSVDPEGRRRINIGRPGEYGVGHVGAYDARVRRTDRTFCWRRAP